VNSKRLEKSHLVANFHRSMASANFKFIDAGANLLDDMYQGTYNGKPRHEADLERVLQRSWENGLEYIIVTSGSAPEAERTITFVEGNERLFTTVGVHPTRANTFEETDPELVLQKLSELCEKGVPSGKVVAVGECGLDYARTKFSSKETQLKHFDRHFALTERFNLPMWLHNRESADDLHKILTANRHRFPTGVVHSFDGTVEEMKRFVDLDLYIGINGCSLKTQANIDMVAEIPLERLILETDAPWCGVKKSSPGYKFVKTQFQSVKYKKYDPEKMVKDRNEPGCIIQVLEVIAGVMGKDLNEVAEAAYANAMKVFFSNKSISNTSNSARSTLSVNCSEDFLSGEYKCVKPAKHYVKSGSSIERKAIALWGEGEYWCICFDNIVFYISDALSGPWTPVGSAFSTQPSVL